MIDINLHISPCPNDTFMFDALINGRLETQLKIEPHFADIEELNARAISQQADVCKVSWAIWPLIARDYRMLASGSALGRGNGPLLVSNSSKYCNNSSSIYLENDDLKIAIPGVHTTANLLMQRLFPKLQNKTAVLFSEIAERVSAGEFDAGVLIHEGRFTYAERGLSLCADLGAEWERREGVPLPLGGIAVRRSLGAEVAHEVENAVRASVIHAMNHPADSRDFVRKHAREMNDAVIDSHIALFVNDFSVDIGKAGRHAVERLTGIAFENYKL